MPRATLDDMVVNYLDGVYRCKMKRVPAKKFGQIARRKDETDGLSDDDPNKAATSIDVMTDILETCVSSIDCEDEQLTVEDLEAGELAAITAAAMNFTAARMDIEAITAGSDSPSTSRPSAE